MNLPKLPMTTPKEVMDFSRDILNYEKTLLNLLRGEISSNKKFFNNCKMLLSFLMKFIIDVDLLLNASNSGRGHDFKIPSEIKEFVKKICVEFSHESSSEIDQTLEGMIRRKRY